MSIPNWQRLGAHAPDALVSERLQLHWAAQIVGAIPYSYLPPAPDDSHNSLTWSTRDAAMVTQSIGKDRHLRIALSVADLGLMIQDGEGKLLAALPLHGRRMEDGISWLAETVARHVDVAPVVPLHRRNLHLPTHPVASGKTFDAGDLSGLSELARWYGNALSALSTIRTRERRATPARIWPHHFDIAALIVLDAAGGSQESRTVGLGMVPGDADYAEPYFYVTPYPRPVVDKFPELSGGGTWHTEGWFGAVLLGSRIVAEAGQAAQATQVERFLDTAIAAALSLL